MAEDPDSAEGSPRREVVVPMELYKPIIVFSTLFAVICVVAGMIALDVATQRGQAASDEVNVILAIGGLFVIALGAGTYAFSTRFRAPEMGNPKDDQDEPSDNG